MPDINMMNCNCMEWMAKCEDNQYDLAIVDPPYGIGITNQSNFIGGKRTSKNKKKDFREWDKKPPKKKYFDQLFRISKNQIVWGGNYFELPPSKGVIVWDKGQRGLSQSDGEMAWSSIGNLRIYLKNRVSLLLQNTFHPTEKPYDLYRWLLKNYAKPGDKILDTHGGSGSICIACHDMGFDIDWMELDEDYYKSAKRRFEDYTQQIRMF